MKYFKFRGVHNFITVFKLITLFLLFFPLTCYSAFSCNDDSYNPTVYKLVKLNDGIEVRLSGIYAKAEADNPAIRMSKILNKPPPNLSPALQWKINKGWKYIDHKKCNYCSSDHSGDCPVKIPNWVNQPQAEIDNWPMTHVIVEKASKCVVQGDDVFFGINFYEGEGYTGNGGFGRYNVTDNKTDVRHLPELSDIPIHKVVWDGTNLWGATTQNYECSGNPPSIGIVKYDWANKNLKKVINDKDAPCGFVINDILIAHGYLWVATDIGISRLHLKNNNWRHYLPERQIPFKVTEASCKSIYNKVLSYQPKDIKFSGDRVSYYENLINNIQKFRPELHKLLNVNTD